MMMGKELKEGIFDNPEYNSIYLESKIWYTYENQEDYREMAERMDPGDVISYWLTIDEVAEEYFQ
jgi:hypothetical protein